MKGTKMKKYLKYVWIGLIVIIILLQFQLLQSDKTNPEIIPTEEINVSANLPKNISTILRKSCYDCHSNETKWPWYSYVAPISILVTDDVNDARKELNFSKWGSYSLKRKIKKLSEINKEVSEGEMPLWFYLPLHPEAKLTVEEQNALVGWTETEYEKLNPEE